MFISKSVRLSAGCRAGEVQGGCVWVLVRVRLMAGSAGGRECARGWTFECELWVGLVETWEALSLLFEITAMLTQDCFIKQRMHCNRYDCFVALGANAYANIMSSCASVRAGDKGQTSNLSGACFLLWRWNMVGHRHSVSNAAAGLNSSLASARKTWSVKKITSHIWSTWRKPFTNIRHSNPQAWDSQKCSWS